MKKTNRTNLYAAALLSAAFVLWTLVVMNVDERSIGPKGSAVGLSSINEYVHNLTGVHMKLYVVTDWLGLVPVSFGLGFALLGLIQWIKRKRITEVDFSILVLGGFYILVAGVYLFFEEFVVNYRPVLIEGFLEASYPSSTTVLVLCVMSTAVIQLYSRIKNARLRKCISGVIIAFIIFMVVGRLISGVHWFSDIIGGVLISAGLIMLYKYIVDLKEE